MWNFLRNAIVAIMTLRSCIFLTKGEEVMRQVKKEIEFCGIKHAGLCAVNKNDVVSFLLHRRDVTRITNWEEDCVVFILLQLRVTRNIHDTSRFLLREFFRKLQYKQPSYHFLSQKRKTATNANATKKPRKPSCGRKRTASTINRFRLLLDLRLKLINSHA